MDLNPNNNGQGNRESNHEIVIKARNSMHITGVINVESFDSEEFLLQTDAGHIGIKGEGLSIQNLDLDRGLLDIEGYVIDISYLDAIASKQDKNKKSFLGRLFQ